MFKLHKIRGGVHPDDNKSLSAHLPVEKLPMPPLLHIPLQQHIGAPAEALVKRGDQVLKGQRLANSQGMISAPIHAPTSGRIVGIGNYPAHHPSGLLVRTITLKPDGKDQWGPLPKPIKDPFVLDSDSLTQRVADAGIVGMGGATFPSAVKLNLHKRHALHTLVINGAECEPYLTCDDRLMQEHAEAVVDGVRIMAHALGVSKVLFGIELNKPAAIASIGAAAAAYDTLHVVGLPTRYPMGSEKHLVQTLVGKETPARGLTAEIGIVVHNVATAMAVQQAVREGIPLIERVVTVSGRAITQPANLRVPLGTPLSHLIDHCGGYSQNPDRLVSGGPMMGQPIPDLKVPTVKGSNGLLALTAAEQGKQSEMPCVRCANCVAACPCGLVPLEMAAFIRAGRLDDSVDRGLLDCIGCGSCAFACQSHIPLVQLFNYAKGELASRQRAQHKQAETKRLAEARTKRMEELKRAKREAMAKRKAEMAAKKAAETKARAATESAPAVEVDA